MLAPIGAEMVWALVPRGGSEHLDIASVAGESGRSVAAVIPRGLTMLTDLPGGMLAAASANADARGLTIIVTRKCGSGDLPFDYASLDTITCLFGFIFFPASPAR